MEKVKPSVRVMSINNCAPAAWRRSRPQSDEPYTNAKKWDSGLEDLITVTMEFDASAAFRELLTVIRPSSCWASSSRNRHIEQIPFMAYAAEVDGPSRNFRGRFVNSEYVLDTLYREAIEETRKSHQDVGRMKLPMAHYAPFTYQCSWRAALSILKSLHKLSPDVYWEHYGKRWLEQLGLTFEQLQESPYKPLHEQYVRQGDWEVGARNFSGIRIVNCEIPIGLRAQLVRQMQIRVYDELWEMVGKNDLSLEHMQVKDMIKCTVVMSDKAYKIMATKRSCFIAQVELWYQFTRPLWDTKGIEATPCEGKKEKCTVVAEAEQCMRGEASTTSCPIYDGKKESLDRRAGYMGESHPIIQIARTSLKLV